VALKGKKGEKQGSLPARQGGRKGGTIGRLFAGRLPPPPKKNLGTSKTQRRIPPTAQKKREGNGWNVREGLSKTVGRFHTQVGKPSATELGGPVISYSGGGKMERAAVRKKVRGEGKPGNMSADLDQKKMADGDLNIAGMEGETGE